MTAKLVHTVIIAFWKALLHMFHASHPVELQDNGNTIMPGHEMTTYHDLCLSRVFPKAGHWRVVPHDVTAGPTAMPAHLWHHLGGTSVYVPHKGLVQHGTGDTLYWFHHSVYLLERARWPAFVNCHDTVYCVIDPPTASREAQGYQCWFVFR